MAAPLPKEELTFGQVAIQQGFATPAMVRECLEVQQKVRALGAKPKMLGEILYEKGYLTPEQINRIFEVQQAHQSQAKKSLEIPGYEIVSKIGQGGMGSVYKARQVRMDRLVALKILPPRLSRDRMFVERFLNEAKTVAKLRHENIVLGIDAGDAGGAYFFVMEYVEGDTVQAILKREGRLDERRALGITLQMARALQHAYEHHMVHRDIKPDNILITKDGTAKLCDLGLAKEQKSDPGLTQAGMAVGTPHYISPEQARGESDIDIRSDLYSLGASLYHMVVGEVPFTGATAAVVMTKHVTTPPTPPRERVRALSEAADELILKCMAKHREQRYQTPAALVQAVEKILAAPAGAAHAPAARPAAAAAPEGASRGHGTTRLETGGSHPVLPPIRRRSSSSPVGGLVAMIVLGAGAFFVYRLMASRDAEPPAPVARPTRTGGSAFSGGGADATPAVSPGQQEQVRMLEEAIARFFESDARLADLPALYVRLDEFARQSRGTPVGGRATELFDGFKRRVDTRSDDAWRAARTAGEEARSRGRLAEALAKYRQFPAALGAFRPDADAQKAVWTHGGKEYDAAVRDLQFQIRNSYLEDVQKITQCLSLGDYRRAWAVGLAVLPYTTPELLQESDPELKALPEKRDEQLGRILAGETEALCKQGRVDAARARCEEVQRDAALPEGVRRRAAALLPEIAKHEGELKAGKKQFLWTAYQAEVTGPLRAALAARDLEGARQVLSKFLFAKADERKDGLWLPELDYPGALRAALGPAPPTGEAVAPFVAGLERAIGGVAPDAAQDAARAVLLDIRAVVLLDDLFRIAEASARAYADTGEPLNPATVMALDRSVFPSTRCLIALDRDGGFSFIPYGKSEPHYGFTLRKGGAGQPLEEEDIVNWLAGRVADPSTRRWRPISDDPRMRFRFGLLYFTCGKEKKLAYAAPNFEAARKGGVPALERYTGKVEAAVATKSGDLVKLEVDRLRDGVQKAQIAQRSWGFVRKDMNDFLAQYGTHPYVQEHRKEIEDLQQQIEAHFPRSK